MDLLEGKVAIVTGAGRGIGRATAELLASHGARVVVGDLDRTTVDEAVGSLAGETVGHVGDLTAAGEPERLVQTAVDTWGRLDIVVNAAGYTLDALAHNISDDWWDRMIDIHLTVPFKVLRAASVPMREAAKRDLHHGHEEFRKIVNVSSVSGTFGNVGQANYASAKAGLVGLTKTLAKEWGHLKINVNAVAFGFVDTRLTARKDERNRAEIAGEEIQLGIPDQVRASVEVNTPLGRTATPQEAAGAIFLLCTPWADYIHGQTLHVNGGMMGGMSAT